MRKLVAGWLIIFVFTLIAGCQNDQTTGPGTGSGVGTLAVRLTDSPAGYDSVVIAVDSIRVHVDSGDSLGGWFTLSRTPAVYDLLLFMGGKDTLVAKGDIPAGYYSQLRLYIGSGSHVVVGGISQPLEIPSGSESGLKLNIQTTINAGVQYVLVLDFDASRSIVLTGNGRYLLKPVIQTVAMSISGSLSGVATPATASPTVWAIIGADSTSTFTDTTGFFEFRYLLPGSYEVALVPSDPTYRDTTLTSISVMPGVNTNLGTIALTKK